MLENRRMLSAKNLRLFQHSSEVTRLATISFNFFFSHTRVYHIFRPVFTHLDMHGHWDTLFHLRGHSNPGARWWSTTQLWWHLDLTRLHKHTSLQLVDFETLPPSPKISAHFTTLTYFFPYWSSDVFLKIPNHHGMKKILQMNTKSKPVGLMYDTPTLQFRFEKSADHSYFSVYPDSSKCIETAPATIILLMTVWIQAFNGTTRY